MNAQDVRGYWLTRLLLERSVGIICLIAFINALNQFKPLLGEQGLLPVRLWVTQVPFRESPSLFYWWPRDAAFTLFSWIGICLSCLVITGIASRYAWLAPLVWGCMYLIYLSFVNVGQTFYGFGWESILLEACFFAIFLGGSRFVPQAIPIWLFRWLLFRIMFGAGLIKLRGDPCWRDLTCLNYFYETQPMPNPVSYYYHWAPEWVNKGGVLFNHFAELIVPFFYFLPQPIAGIAGLITIVFQLFIISSGNLSWLNWLTLFLAFSTLDAKFFSFLSAHLHWPTLTTPPIAAHWVNVALGIAVAIMSVPVILNMVSAGQIMNTSFNSFHLVGTYGAFGSITRPRYEVIIEGTQDKVITPATQWREYEFKAKPGQLNYRPPQIAPYHLRIDWLMWFAAMSSYEEYPWFVNLLAKLLQNDQAVISLLRTNPFQDKPPHYIRAQSYEYHFTTPAEHAQTGNWWKRTLVGAYFPAVSMDSPGFRRVLERQGWLPPQSASASHSSLSNP
ncbi:MAG TPA: lipase maturation factor family protein [Bryobacteraceae bacterium]|nr:lipase maturation factor family protein [Bryobacteraceae bacterium]